MGSLALSTLGGARRPAKLPKDAESGAGLPGFSGVFQPPVQSDGFFSRLSLSGRQMSGIWQLSLVLLFCSCSSGPLTSRYVS